MANVLIYDVAAENGGAATVLQEFYKKSLEDNANKYVFVVSVVSLQSTGNVEVVSLPWVKTSRFHRLFCDLFYIQKIIKRYNIDEVVSLQNIGIRRCCLPQTIYVQNALFFSEVRFSFSESRNLWIYQNIINIFVYSSLRRADKVLVQTQWMKDVIVNRLGIDADKIAIESVVVNVLEPLTRIATATPIFFYPSNAEIYKNHRVIINACKMLRQNGIEKYQVIFTLDPKENSNAMKLYEMIKEEKLPISFIGRQEKKEMNYWYRKSILLFPSYLETVGLPLLEAQKYNAFIIAADTPFARENLLSYDKKIFFKNDDTDNLYMIMKGFFVNEN